MGYMRVKLALTTTAMLIIGRMRSRTERSIRMKMKRASGREKVSIFSMSALTPFCAAMRNEGMPARPTARAGAPSAACAAFSEATSSSTLAARSWVKVKPP